MFESMPPALRKVLFWIPPAAWGLLIFYLSTRPSGPQPSWWFNHADKVIHFVIFSIFSTLLFIAGHFGNRWNYRRAAATALVITALYGLSDEFHQSFTPTRSVDPLDALADTCGGSMAFVTGRMLRKGQTRDEQG
jgi:VanZ family protein